MMKKNLAGLAMMAVIAVASLPAFSDTGNGCAVEAYTDGTVGVAYYQQNYELGINGGYSNQSPDDSVTSINGWAGLRRAMTSTLFMGLGVNLGTSTGTTSGSKLAGILTTGVYTSLELAVAPNVLVQGVWSLGATVAGTTGSDQSRSISSSGTMCFSYLF